MAHPTVAAYFLSTGQPIFVLGNAIMTAGGLYGTWRALRARRRTREAAAMAEAIREGWDKGVASVADRAVAAAEALDNTPQ